MRAELSQIDRLRTLIEVSRSLTAELDLNDIIHGILGGAIRVIQGADAGILFLYEPGVRKLVVSHAVGMGPPAYEITIDPGEGLSGKAFVSRKPGIYSDQQATATGMSGAREENLRRFEDATGGVRFPQSALSAALVYKGEPIGAFVVENLYVPHAFDSFDLDLVDALAQAAAAAIVNARLFESEKESRIKLEALNAEIRVQRDQLQRRISVQESLSEVVKEGLPLSALATRLARLTQGLVVVLDALNRIRASEPQLESESARELDWIEADSLLAALDGASRMRARQRVSDDSGGEIVLSPVVGGGEVLGFIGVKPTERGLDAVDEVAADSAALVAAAEFLKERAIEENEIRDRANVLEELLEGRIPPRASAFSMLRAPLGLTAATLRNEKAPGATPDVKLLRTLVAVTQEVVERGPAPALVTVRGEYVVVVWSISGEGESEIESDLRNISAKLQRIAPEWRITFGLGARTDRLEDLADTYNEVRLGLEVRERLGRYSPVFRVGALGAYRFILRAATGGHVAEFCDQTLGRAIEHDTRRDSELLATFRSYLDAGSSLKAAAEILGVHPHTVQYRLDRLQQVTGLSFGNPEERLTLEMALRVADALQLVHEPNE
jgi:GAF domain-containing protein